MSHAFSRKGFTFLELLIAILIVGVLSVLAVPSFRSQVDRIRVRSALDHVVAELYRARMTAVETGGPARLVLQADREGCIQAFRLSSLRGEVERSGRFQIDLPGVCLTQSGDSIILFNSRGMLRPPARSLRVTYGAFADSVLISIAGRARRTYRRRCR
jgi:prepilin-type N-terminal cleavage/methylation domain-containing protein